jgi:hypothetical protein
MFDPTVNNVMENSSFIKIFYSTSLFVMNGVYINVPIVPTTVNRHLNKIFISFSKFTHHNIIQQLSIIERQILSQVHYVEKTPMFKIRDQLSQGEIRMYKPMSSDPIGNINLTLKISGIWETNDEYGLTFKFIFTP